MGQVQPHPAQAARKNRGTTARTNFNRGTEPKKTLHAQIRELWLVWLNIPLALLYLSSEQVQVPCSLGV